MAESIPIKALYIGGDSCALAEYQAADFIGIVNGGTGQTSAGIDTFVQPGCFGFDCGTTFLGICAGSSTLEAGKFNTMIGYRAGMGVSSSCSLVLIGMDAGKTITTGAGSTVAIGQNAGCLIDTGVNNTLVGTNTGRSLTTESNNTFIGLQSGYSATSSDNTAIGSNALFSLSTGDDSVAIGTDAGKTVSVNSDNIFIGKHTGCVALCGDNTLIGSKAGLIQSVGTNNTMVGVCTGIALTIGNSNTLVGSRSGLGLIGGSNNIFIGSGAGCLVTQGVDNIVIGNCMALTTTTECSFIVGSGDTTLIFGCLADCSLAFGNGNASFANEFYFNNGRLRVQAVCSDNPQAMSMNNYWTINYASGILACRAQFTVAAAHGPTGGGSGLNACEWVAIGFNGVYSCLAAGNSGGFNGPKIAVQFRKINQTQSSPDRAGDFVFINYNEDDSHFESMRIDYCGLVGIGTNTPEGTLHIHSGTAGAVTACTTADDLVIESSGDGGLSILTPAANNGRIYFGSPTNPAYGQIDYDHNTNEMVFATAGAGRLIIDSSGNVGIGTEPDHTLHVKDAADNAVVEVETSATDGNPAFRLKNDAQEWQWQLRGAESDSLVAWDVTGGAGRLYLTTSGNLGIGTTDPVTKLHLQDDAFTNRYTSTSTNPVVAVSQGVRIQNLSDTDNNFAVGTDFFNSTGFVTGRFGAIFRDAGDRNTDLYWATRANSANLTAHMFLTSAGRLGIGTCAPCKTVHIDKSSGSLPALGTDDILLLQNNECNTCSTRVTLISGGVSGEGFIGFGDDSTRDSGRIRYTHSDNKMVFGTNAQNGNVCINSSNQLITSTNVGIGTASPNYLLSVRTSADHQFHVRDSSTDAGNEIQIQAGNDADNALQNMKFAADRYYFEQGSVGIGTAAPTTRIHVSGASTVSALRLDETTSSANSYLGYIDTSGNFGIDVNGGGYLRFAVNSAERAVLDASGNLTLQTNQAADTELAIYNTNSSASAKGSLKVGYDAANHLHIYRAGNAAGIVYNATQSGSSHQFQIAGSAKATLDATGNLLVGGTSQSGTANRAAVFSGNKFGLSIIDTTAQDTGVGGALNLGGNYRASGDAQAFARIEAAKENATDTNYAYGMAFSTTPNGGTFTEAVRIDSAGRVGIGTNVTDARLEVRGDGGEARNDVDYGTITLMGCSPATGCVVPLLFNMTNVSSRSRAGIAGVDLGGAGYCMGLAFYAKNRSDGTALSVADEKMRLTSSGLGIGTCDPLLKLHVQGDVTGGAYNSAVGQIVISGETDCNKRLNIGFDTSTNKAFLQSGINGIGYNDLLLNPNGGSVGIGTNSPSRRLSVLGEGDATVATIITPSTNGGNFGIIDLKRQDCAINSSVGVRFSHGNSAAATNDIEYGFIGGGIEVATASSEEGFLNFAVGPTRVEKMRITNAGNLGLNIAAPSTNAVIHAVATNFTGASGAIILEDKRADANPFIQVENDARAWNLQTVGARSDNFEIYDSTATSTRLAVTSAGLVGIGNTSPVACKQLDVRVTSNCGNIRTGGLYISPDDSFSDRAGYGDMIYARKCKSTSGSFWGIRFENYTEPTCMSFTPFWYRYKASGDGVADTDAFKVMCNGNVENINNSYTGISDCRLKKCIVDAPSQWCDISQLRIRNFEFCNINEGKKIGVIAQEAEAIMPGLVNTAPTEYPDGSPIEDSIGQKSFNYSILYMKAVKALQEAMERIELLEDRVAVLEAA